MKIIKVILLIVIIAIAILTMYIIQKNSRKKVQEEIIKTWINDEENIVKEDTIVEQFSDNAIGKLKIPIIGVEAEIAEGTDLDILTNYIGHFKNSGLWDGNVALARHNIISNHIHYIFFYISRCNYYFRLFRLNIFINNILKILINYKKVI